LVVFQDYLNDDLQGGSAMDILNLNCGVDKVFSGKSLKGRRLEK